MNDNNCTGTGSVSTVYSYNASCQYRLPCGYCRLLEKQCPNSLGGYPNVVYTTATNNTQINEEK